MAKIPQHKTQKRLENVVNKIITKIKLAIKEQQILYMGFQDRPEILLNTAMDTVTSNQLRKMTNAQFEELQTKITQVILEKEVQEIIQEGELKKLNFNRAQY
ncbi:hypothetical protein G9A89_021372 [Geosiphon pyriformis]|nr:hypothetical protein G9A89_021372 [Geosiphon pyriformis]